MTKTQLRLSISLALPSTAARTLRLLLNKLRIERRPPKHRCATATTSDKEPRVRGQ